MAGPVEYKVVTVAGGAAMLWRFDVPHHAISTATIMDGVQAVEWISNAPANGSGDGSDIAPALGLSTDGLELVSAGAIDQPQTATRTEIRIDATIAGTPDAVEAASGDPAPGLVNAVIQLPVGFEGGGALSAAITVAEAKTQALIEAGAAETGSADDALVLCWPVDAPIERQAGPKSTWGARLATIVHQVVVRGAKAAQ